MNTLDVLGTSDTSAEFDANVPDSAIDAPPDVGVDGGPACEPSAAQALRPSEGELYYGAEIALSRDGSTLAVSSENTLSIYTQDDGAWSLVHRRSGSRAPGRVGQGHSQRGGVDIDDAGSTVIWGDVIFSELAEPGAAGHTLVFERGLEGDEWTETSLERAHDALSGGQGVAVSGDGSTLAIQNSSGGEASFTLYERGEDNEDGEWRVADSFVRMSLNNINTIALSRRGDRIVWSEEARTSVYAEDESGEWLLELQVYENQHTFALDAEAERMVIRTILVVVVYDRVGSTWTETARFREEQAVLGISSVAISGTGTQIYGGQATGCGVRVLSWTERGGRWTAEPPRSMGVFISDARPYAIPLPVDLANDGTVALGVPAADLAAEPSLGGVVYVVR